MPMVVQDPRFKKKQPVSEEDILRVIRERRPDKLFQMGKALLERDRARDAITALELAYQASPTEPLYMSYLGLATAMTRSPGHDAVSLCEQAARQEFYKAELLNNLGRVYLMSGQRKKAYDMFKKGIETDSEFFQNHLCLEAMGVRSRPVFGFLHRNHPVNMVAGKTLRRLGLRV